MIWMMLVMVNQRNVIIFLKLVKLSMHLLIIMVGMLEP